MWREMHMILIKEAHMIFGLLSLDEGSEQK